MGLELMDLDVTVAITVRETFSTTIRSMKSFLEFVPTDVKVVFVSPAVPKKILDEVEVILKKYDSEIVYKDTFLTPNQIRNLALEHVKTKYVAFIDNDVLVKDDWLTPLIKCAEEENASIVTPLIFERFPVWKFIHAAGGEGEIQTGPNGERICHQLPYHLHHDLEVEPLEFKREKTGLVEFHTVLIETEFLKSSNGLDAEIRCMFEEWDMCMQAAAQGKKIYIEPESKVAYLPPFKPTEDDLRFFNLRWSERWLEESIERLTEKHNLTPDTGNLRVARGFVKTHRLHKYGKLRKQISDLFGRKLASVFLNRIVAYWDRYRNNSVAQEDYAVWKKYTDSAA